MSPQRLGNGALVLGPQGMDMKSRPTSPSDPADNTSFEASAAEGTPTPTGALRPRLAVDNPAIRSATIPIAVSEEHPAPLSSKQRKGNKDREKKEKRRRREEEGLRQRAALRAQEEVSIKQRREKTQREEAALRERKEYERIEQLAAAALRDEKDKKDAEERRVADEAAQKARRERPIELKDINFWAEDEDSEDEDLVNTPDAVGQQDITGPAMSALEYPNSGSPSGSDMGASAAPVGYSGINVPDLPGRGDTSQCLDTTLPSREEFPTPAGFAPAERPVSARSLWAAVVAAPVPTVIPGSRHSTRGIGNVNPASATAPVRPARVSTQTVPVVPRSSGRRQARKSGSARTARANAPGPSIAPEAPVASGNEGRVLPLRLRSSVGSGNPVASGNKGRVLPLLPRSSVGSGNKFSALSDEHESEQAPAEGFQQPEPSQPATPEESHRGTAKSPAASVSAEGSDHVGSPDSESAGSIEDEDEHTEEAHAVSTLASALAGSSSTETVVPIAPPQSAGNASRTRRRQKETAKKQLAKAISYAVVIAPEPVVEVPVPVNVLSWQALEGFLAYLWAYIQSLF